MARLYTRGTCAVLYRLAAFLPKYCANDYGRILFYQQKGTLKSEKNFNLAGKVVINNVLLTLYCNFLSHYV